MSNIVRAVFGGSKTTRTRRLWKIDKGMQLQFVGLNLPAAYQVHFANEPSSGQAKVVTATSDTVEIPYEYLQTGADVYAWVYLTPEDGVGYTEYMVTIPVYARPDVTDEEPTPAQQSALDTAISALNSGVESVQAAVAGVQDSINTALQEAKDSGEFDGADGYTPVKGVDYFDGEKGDTGATGETGNGIASVVLNADYTLTLTYTDGTTWTSGSIRGDKGDKGETGSDGYSPSATVTQTATGATVTVTDKTGTTTAEISNGQDGATFTPDVSAEGVISWTNDGGKTNPQPVSIKGPAGVGVPTGGRATQILSKRTNTDYDTQWIDAGGSVPTGGSAGQVLAKKTGLSYDTEWVDQTGGGGGTSDYTDLTNKPSINGVTLTGNKSLSDLGAASESAVAAKYTKPSTGIPASDLASAVQTSLGKADTALQSAPVTSVNGSTGAVVLSIPSTAADVGAIAAPASPATGAFLVWSGNAWTAQTLATWEGGSF